MPRRTPDKVQVPCPFCGHQQSEPRTAISTNCRGCGQHFLVQAALNPAPKTPDRAPDQRRISCFDCGTELGVPLSAQSTMCKRCGRYIDLSDYRIANAVSKNFKTKGLFVVESKGYVFNTEAVVGEAVIKGKFLGKLKVERSLTLHSSAQIKGTFQTAHLVIPAGHHFQWQEPINVTSADIAGELVAALQATGRVRLSSTARLFGDISSKHLVVDEGAVLVGKARIGPQVLNV